MYLNFSKRNQVRQLENEGFLFSYKSKIQELLLKPYKLTCEFPRGAKIENFHFPNFSSLKEVVIWNQDLKKYNLEVILGCDSLKFLDLRGCSFDEILHVSNLPHLVYFRATETNIDDRRLTKILEKTSILKALILDNTKVTGDIIQILNNLNHLETLNIEYTLISSEAIRGLTIFDQLGSVSDNIFDVFQDDSK